MALPTIAPHLFQTLHFFALPTQLDIIDQGGNGGVVFFYIFCKLTIVYSKLRRGDRLFKSVPLETYIGVGILCDGLEFLNVLIGVSGV